MSKHIQEIQKTLSHFRQTPYHCDFECQLTATIIIWIFYIITGFLTLHLAWSDYKTFTFSCIWILFGLFLLILLSVTYWIRYYRTVIAAALKIETIKTKYTLIDTDRMTTYESSLQIILDLIDSSLEKEYSNKLLQKQAELDAMQSQINPHFLYNTLDTIRGYAMMEGAAITSDMVEILSRLFRYMISQKNPLVTLNQELNILYDYIKIQEYRNNQHIIFRQVVEPDLQINDYQIPKLIIQPFVENAIKHGLNGISKDFIITLNIHSTQSRLVISISDNGNGMDPEQLRTLNLKFANNESDSVHIIKDKSKGTGIALTNVNARIKLLYGKEFGITAYSTLGKGSEFQITLPYHPNLEN